MTRYRVYHLKLHARDGDTSTLQDVRHALHQHPHVRSVKGSDGAVETLKEARQFAEWIEGLFPSVRTEVLSVRRGQVDRVKKL